MTHQTELVPDDYFRELRREDIFPNSDSSRPLEVDLGCGDGGFLLDLSQQLPDRDFLAVERVKGRVHKVRQDLQREGRENAKVLRLDSTYVVGWLLPAKSVSRLHLLCPDPWPKKKHHKNRILRSQEFLEGLERILVPGGEFLLKTDQEDYFEEALEALERQPWAKRLSWENDDEVDPYPQTDFERHWLGLGRSIHRARWANRTEGT